MQVNATKTSGILTINISEVPNEQVKAELGVFVPDLAEKTSGLWLRCLGSSTD